MVTLNHRTLGRLIQLVMPLNFYGINGIKIRIKQACHLMIQVVIGVLCYSLFSVAQSAPSKDTNDFMTFSTPALEDVDRLITLSIKPTKLMLGEPITVTIVGEHRANLFAGLDWQRFEQDFVLYDVDSDSERIKVRLYPLKSGVLNIQGQTVGRMILPDININVTANPEVLVHWFGPNSVVNSTTPSTSTSTSMTSLYAHQQTVWKADVQVKDMAHKISYEQRAPTMNSSVTTYLQALPVDSQTTFFGDIKESQTGLPSAKTETLVASYEVKDWSTSARQRVLLHSPAVVVKNRSNRRWYFFDKPNEVILKPLPSFLPMTIPVGHLDWQSEPIDQIHTVGELHYWTWQLQGHGLTQAYMNSVAHQLVAQIKHDPQIEWLSDSRETSMQFTREGMQSTLSLRLPYRVNQPGLVSLPVLQLRYFNPLVEKLEVILSPETTVLALPAWVVWMGRWLLLMAMVLFTFMGLLSLKQAWLNWRLQQVITQATSVDSLWQGLIDWRQNQSYQAWSVLKWPNKSVDKMASQGINKQSLGQWIQWYTERFGNSKTFAELVKELNFMLYARHEQIGAEDWQRLLNCARSWSQTLSGWKLPLMKMLTRFKSD